MGLFAFLGFTAGRKILGHLFGSSDTNRANPDTKEANNLRFKAPSANDPKNTSDTSKSLLDDKIEVEEVLITPLPPPPLPLPKDTCPIETTITDQDIGRVDFSASKSSDATTSNSDKALLKPMDSIQKPAPREDAIEEALEKLKKDGMIRLADGLKLPKEMIDESKDLKWLQTEFMSAFTSAASDLSPTCRETVLSIMRSPTFGFLFVGIRPGARAYTAHPKTNTGAIKLTTYIPINNVQTRKDINDTVDLVLHHEMLIHLQSTNEDIEQSSSSHKQQSVFEPGLFIPTKSALLTAVEKDRILSNTIMGLVSRAKENGINRLPSDDQKKLNHYIDIVSRFYKPTIMYKNYIAKTDNPATIQEYKDGIKVKTRYAIETTDETKFLAGTHSFIRNWEDSKYGTWFFFSPAAAPEQLIYKIDKDLLMLKDFLTDFNTQLKRAENRSHKPEHVAAEYIAYLQGIFKSNLDFAKVFIPNIVKYLSENYRAVGCLCEHPKTDDTQHLDTAQNLNL